MMNVANHPSPAQPVNMRAFSGQMESIQHVSPSMNQALPVPSPLISMVRWLFANVPALTLIYF